MLYKATVSFSGLISMASGEVRELSDQAIIDDLLKAGYIMELDTEKQAEAEDKPKPKKKPATKRKGKDNED